jgi:hypothetical protein
MSLYSEASWEPTSSSDGRGGGGGDTQNSVCFPPSLSSLLVLDVVSRKKRNIPFSAEVQFPQVSRELSKIIKFHLIRSLK